MRSDPRPSRTFENAASLCRGLLQPGTGQITDAAELSVDRAGAVGVFTGTIVDDLKSPTRTRICLVDLSTGDMRVVSFGPNNDRSPRFSADGRSVAFLSDRSKSGDFQLYLLHLATGAAKPAPPVDGWVEHITWSPDGTSLLVGVAGHGADVSSTQGAVASGRDDPEAGDWMPEVQTGVDARRWRRLAVYQPATNTMRQIEAEGLNIWEACWCGEDHVVAVTSDGAGEGLWYSSALRRIAVADGCHEVIHRPEDQIGLPSASPSGRRALIIEAICSDRGLVAGAPVLFDLGTGQRQVIDAGMADVTSTQWLDEHRILMGGHRAFETVVGVHDLRTGRFTEHWSSETISGTGRYLSVSAQLEEGASCFIAEGFERAPEIGCVANGEYHTVRSFAADGNERARAHLGVERVSWTAPDGLVIHGYLLKPADSVGPLPVIMNIHGGPVWHWKPTWVGRSGGLMLALLECGYAVFLPNPRGSSGRGREFVLPVIGDPGGIDAADLLSGLESLTKSGVADANRLGVTGGSYGGFMTAWLVTQDGRFAAAAPVCPHTNQMTEHLLGNIPHFVKKFFGDSFDTPNSRYLDRSPVMHASKARTPTLNICGALDRCTPPAEAAQFHAALLEYGVESVLVTYPKEGHGIRGYPAVIDYVARLVDWFDAHLRHC